MKKTKRKPRAKNFSVSIILPAAHVVVLREIAELAAQPVPVVAAVIICMGIWSIKKGDKNANRPG